MLKDALLKEYPELEMKEGERLSTCTTFRIGGPVRLLILPHSVEELQGVLRLCAACGERPLILGNGSNVLAPDEGLDCVTICTRNMTQLQVQEDCIVAEAGCTLARVANAALQAGLTGLEFAHGIPGTLGGGTVMNAGAYGGELKDVITQVVCLTLDGERLVKTGAELDFGYRHSCFESGELVIASVSMQLQRGDAQTIKARMDELAGKRRASQPLEYPSAGSTFKRPEGYFAAKLIQDCGLKGLQVGGAQVSVKHSGFVINTGGATCQDVLALVGEIKAQVLAQTGVTLELEVRLLQDLLK